jgi:flagellar secretion chaperone FliS
MSNLQTQYLESKILTAGPHRLHLLLIEGALRYGRQAEAALRGGDATAAAGPLLRVIDIVGELLSAVRERSSDINKQLADLYWFLFRCVSEAKINSDAARLAEALRLLEFERETWVAVCEKFGSGAEPPPSARIDSAPSSPGLSLQA